jgi:hypothetical protein
LNDFQSVVLQTHKKWASVFLNLSTWTKNVVIKLVLFMHFKSWSKECTNTRVIILLSWKNFKNEDLVISDTGIFAWTEPVRFNMRFSYNKCSCNFKLWARKYPYKW